MEVLIRYSLVWFGAGIFDMGGWLWVARRATFPQQRPNLHHECGLDFDPQFPLRRFMLCTVFRWASSCTGALDSPKGTWWLRYRRGEQRWLITVVWSSSGQNARYGVPSFTGSWMWLMMTMMIMPLRGVGFVLGDRISWVARLVLLRSSWCSYWRHLNVDRTATRHMSGLFISIFQGCVNLLLQKLKQYAFNDVDCTWAIVTFLVINMSYISIGMGSKNCVTDSTTNAWVYCMQCCHQRDYLVHTIAFGAWTYLCSIHLTTYS
jgi:hypothetical protein